MAFKNPTPERVAARLESWRAEKLASVPSLYRGIYRKAYSGTSRAAGVHAFCLYCTGDMREEVRNCSSWRCPLWPYRPYQDDAAHPKEQLTSAAESPEMDGDMPEDCQDQNSDSGTLERPPLA